jgi:hypothetical protein
MSPRIFFNTIRLRSKNIFFHGAILAFYVIAAITTFFLGIYGFIRMSEVDFSKVGTAAADYNFSLRSLDTIIPIMNNYGMF